MAGRVPILPGIWAANADTVVPSSPVKGTTYRDPAFDGADIEQAWPFDTIVDSKDFNQFLYILSSVVRSQELTGILEWNDTLVYPDKAWVKGSDGLVYISNIAANTNKNPITEPEWDLLTDSLVVPDASTTVKGKVELATNAETAAGTDTTRAITPAALASMGFGSGGTSPAGTGYTTLDNGIIIQWGSLGSSGTTSQSFPIVFPTAAFVAVGCFGSGGNPQNPLQTNWSNSAVSFVNFSNNSTTKRWIAIGH